MIKTLCLFLTCIETSIKSASVFSSISNLFINHTYNFVLQRLEKMRDYEFVGVYKWVRAFVSEAVFWIVCLCAWKCQSDHVSQCSRAKLSSAMVMSCRIIKRSHHTGTLMWRMGLIVRPWLWCARTSPLPWLVQREWQLPCLFPWGRDPGLQNKANFRIFTVWTHVCVQ